MRLLANENFPRIAVEALRARGHDVAWVRTDSPGTSDEEVIHRAVAETRVLVTFDKDFGELTFRLGCLHPAASSCFGSRLLHLAMLHTQLSQCLKAALTGPATSPSSRKQGSA
jgi:Domain of unknown function (DUF5615)